MIVAQEDKERHRFFVASACLREDNEIHLIEFNEDSEFSDAVSTVATYKHPSLKDVWSMAPSPVDTSLFMTSSSDGGIAPFSVRGLAVGEAMFNDIINRYSLVEDSARRKLLRG